MLSKYFHITRKKQKKKASKEEDHAEEIARMTTYILEFKEELMTLRGCIKWQRKKKMLMRGRSRVKWLLKV